MLASIPSLTMLASKVLMCTLSCSTVMDVLQQAVLLDATELRVECQRYVIRNYEEIIEFGSGESASGGSVTFEYVFENKAVVTIQDSTFQNNVAVNEVNTIQLETHVGGCDVKDEVIGNTVCSATATKWCTEHIQECTGLATPDSGALAACVKDMVTLVTSI